MSIRFIEMCITNSIETVLIAINHCDYRVLPAFLGAFSVHFGPDQEVNMAFREVRQSFPEVTKSFPEVRKPFPEHGKSFPEVTEPFPEVTKW